MAVVTRDNFQRKTRGLHPMMVMMSNLHQGDGISLLIPLLPHVYLQQTIYLLIQAYLHRAVMLMHLDLFYHPFIDQKSLGYGKSSLAVNTHVITLMQLQTNFFPGMEMAMITVRFQP